MRNYIEGKIIKYIKGTQNENSAVPNFSNISVERIVGGDYNLNFKLTLDSSCFLFRLNIEPQSGQKNQIAYEYKTLNLLAPYELAPRPLLYDDSKNIFPYDFLMEEYIGGQKFVFSFEAVERVAKALARLHNIKTDDTCFLRRSVNPLQCQMRIINDSLHKYRNRKVVNQKIISIATEWITLATALFSSSEKKFVSKSIVHTDLVPSNIIDTGSKIVFIDWEKGIIDDPSYDVVVFLSPLANLWDSPRTINYEEKEHFFEVYIKETNDVSIRERVGIRSILFSAQALLWAGNRIADVDEGKMDDILGKYNYEKYNRLVANANIMHENKLLS